MTRSTTGWIWAAFLPLALSGVLMVVFALNRLALILTAPAKQGAV